jgi:hypothetical protein
MSATETGLRRAPRESIEPSIRDQRQRSLSGELKPRVARAWFGDGRPWHRTANWLIRTARRIARHGLYVARAMVRRRLHVGRFLQVPAAELLPRMVDRRRAQRLSRRRTVPTVIVAEHWQDDDGHDMVVFHESGPYPRGETWFA